MTRPDVRRLGESALAWASEHRSDFRLGDGALDVDGDVNRTWKPLGELAQVCVTVLRATGAGEPMHRTASGLLAFAWEQTDRGDLFLELQRLEPFATYPLEVYAAFASAGLRHTGYEKAAAIVARTRGWRMTEQDPNRRLGVINAERRSGLPQHGETLAALRQTWLGGLPEPWTFERAAGYTLTHVIFHLTDWGFSPHAVPRHVAAYLSHWLPAWLDTCVEDEQWDLGCELLAVAASLPRPPDPAYLDGPWARIGAAQDGAGALAEVGPGRTGRAVPRTFANCYHSTLMAAFAAVLTVSRENGTPAGTLRAGGHRPHEPAAHARTDGQGASA